MKRKKPVRPEPLPLPGSPRKAPQPLDLHRAIQTAKDALAAQDGQGTISLSELASSLGIDKNKIIPLVEHGYLKVIEGEMVALPSRAAFDWLKSMFTPLPLRPMVSTEMISSMSGMAIPNVRRMYAFYNIPVQIDEVFGELLTIEGLYTLWEKMSEFRDPTRFDRQAFISLFQQKGKVLRTKPLEFSDKLELEIVRICKLKEPNRSFAAAALWDAFEHASTIEECAKRYAATVTRALPDEQPSVRFYLSERLEAVKKKLSLPCGVPEP
jgi:hypothetical protein